MKPTRTILLILVAAIPTAPARADSTPPLVLESKIALDHVQGRIDHLAADIARQRLYVAERQADGIRIIPILQQHVLAVDTIKRNRAAENFDTVIANRGKVRYECVWCEGDAGGKWVCMFALDIYDWRDLGSHTAEIPSRGCVGMYLLPDRSVPEAAARDLKQSVAVPNHDVLDPFAP